MLPTAWNWPGTESVVVTLSGAPTQVTVGVASSKFQPSGRVTGAFSPTVRLANEAW